MSTSRPLAFQPLPHPRLVLVVDHEVEYRQNLCASLIGAGYGIIEARNGEEALRSLTDAPLTAVFLDSSAGGFCADLCRRIRAIPVLREVFLIVMSTHDDASSVIQALDAGADDYGLKRTDFEVLKAKLRAHLRRRSNGFDPHGSANSVTLAEQSEFDAEALSRLQESIDVHSLIELIDTVIGDVSERLTALFTALERGDAPAVVSQAHHLKWTAATFGGRRIAAECAEIEAMGRAGRLSEIGKAAIQLRTRLKRFTDELRAARHLRASQLP